MLVYRFENTHSGYGPWAPTAERDHYEALGKRWSYGTPYNGVAHYNDARRSGEDPYLMPSAYSEPSVTPIHRHASYGSMDGWFFGFGSLTSMRQTFGSKPGRRAMHEAGVPLVVYDVPEDHVMRGTRQVIFRKDRAVRLHTLDPTTLKPIANEGEQL